MEAAGRVLKDPAVSEPYKKESERPRHPAVSEQGEGQEGPSSLAVGSAGRRCRDSLEMPTTVSEQGEGQEMQGQS